MPGERTYPCLPCADLDEAIAFYQALGFTRTYRQLAPNPYAVVARGDLQIHLFGMPDFVPEQSYGSVIVTVPDADSLYRAFAGGLRERYGKLPLKGIPRITRPRKKQGTVRGFSVVDVGGNWLRVFGATSESADDEAEAQDGGLTAMTALAARLGDAHGDEAKALRALEKGLQRFPDAPPLDLARALLYRAELAFRAGDGELARASIAQVHCLDLNAHEQTRIAEELAFAAETILSGETDDDSPQ